MGSDGTYSASSCSSQAIDMRRRRHGPGVVVTVEQGQPPRYQDSFEKAKRGIGCETRGAGKRLKKFA